MRKCCSMKAKRKGKGKAAGGFSGFSRRLQREDAAAIAMALVFLFFYLTTLSASLEEEDSAHFALALTDYNITQNHPHPPGFPVYVFIGRMFLAVTGNELLALASMSAVFGALSMLAVYVFMRERLGRQRALAASVVCASTPLFWLSAVKALSDMTGLFFLIVPLALLWRYNSCGGRRLAYIGMFVSGIAAGVRIHTALLLLPAAALALRERKEKPVEILTMASLFVAGACVWGVPLLLVSGPSAYMASSGLFMYGVGNPEISLIGVSSPMLPLQKLWAELYYFLMDGYGVNLWAPGILGLALLAAFPVLLWLIARRIPGQKDFIFFSVPLAVYCALIFILLPAFNPRYFLVLVPFVSAALAAGIWKIGKKGFRLAALSVLFALLLAHSIALASGIHDEKAPMLQMVEYLERMPGREIVVSGEFLYDYVIYYHAAIDVISEDAADCSVLSGLLKDGRAVFSTRVGNCACIAYPKASVFMRDMRIHVKRSVVELHSLSLIPC